jgi:hypothetical protein
LYLNQGITRARATNALGTGPVIVNPGAILDFNAVDNLGASQTLTIRSNSNFLPMISVNTDIAHPTGANVNATGAPVGIIGLSNTTGGTYNTPINMGALYGGGWYLGGISTGAYDARYTAASLGVGAGNTYRLGGGGLAFIFSVDAANVERNNLLTGASSNVLLGHDSGNIRGATQRPSSSSLVERRTMADRLLIHRGTVARITGANNGTQSGLSSSRSTSLETLSSDRTPRLRTVAEGLRIT